VAKVFKANSQNGFEKYEIKTFCSNTDDIEIARKKTAVCADKLQVFATLNFISHIWSFFILMYSIKCLTK
jgi:hypothetical protein